MGSPAPLSRMDFSGTKLLIGVPTRGQCSTHFASSLAVACCYLNAAKVEFTVIKGENSCFVDVKRNQLLAKFMGGDFTHILMIDDDMGFDPLAPIKMLKHDREFIAGAGNLKTDAGDEYACKIFTRADDTPFVDDAGLIKASHVGGAFILLKRSLVEKMISAYPEHKNPFVDPATGFKFFEPEYRMSGFITEDYNFCERWTKIGGEIWIYPDISFTHTGMKDFKGNYHEFLIAQNKPATIKSVANISGIPVTTFANPSNIEAVIERQDDPDVRKNGFITAIEKIILCESYINRIAKAVVRIQEETARHEKAVAR